ncbi:uncharacterized protein LOC117319596 [Pecten maximus]|uniref:uncharacterized protein LOC117319596 n=1 Tax=Pecten maximus TaxID=6579 RepID=UPI0014590E35|nr:uncharacterized protein LOC117319596 [Pecten maximus]
MMTNVSFEILFKVHVKIDRFVHLLILIEIYNTDGCVDGRYGDRCELPCLENCTSCTRDGEQCLAEKQTEDDGSNVGTYVGVGGVLIVVGLIVIIAVVCIIKRKSSTSGETASSPSVAYGGPNPSNNSNRHSGITYMLLCSIIIFVAYSATKVILLNFCCTNLYYIWH